MNLRHEMVQLVRALDAASIPYALCGGLAMAVYGWPRATMDIDILVEESRLGDVQRVAKSVGFTHESGEMNLAGGRMRICRLVKTMGEEFFPLDILVVTPVLDSAWAGRTQVQTGDGLVTVVSSEGLIRMKMLRNSGTDQDDIRKLKGESDASD